MAQGHLVGFGPKAVEFMASQFLEWCLSHYTLPYWGPRKWSFYVILNKAHRPTQFFLLFCPNKCHIHFFGNKLKSDGEKKLVKHSIELGRKNWLKDLVPYLHIFSLNIMYNFVMLTKQVYKIFMFFSIIFELLYKVLFKVLMNC